MLNIERWFELFRGFTTGDVPGESLQVNTRIVLVDNSNLISIVQYM